uniref:Uncharacterized protein n=1 Tax=Anguilla anguilla TaxID=7936 RepID=A0A0E9TV26_ANGAN
MKRSAPSGVPSHPPDGKYRRMTSHRNNLCKLFLILSFCIFF